jgi:DNA-binding NtrC family response regulator
MNDHVRLDILHKLAVTPVNNSLFDNPSDYLKWFLKQVSQMFDENSKLRFANIQYFSSDNITNKEFLHGRLLDIPTLINLDVIGENNLLKMLTDVTTFLAATSVIQHFHSEPNRATINTFRDRLKIETIRETVIESKSKKLFYDKNENLMTILLPDLYNQNNSELLVGKEFYKHADLKIENINEKQIILEGSSFNNKIDSFTKSDNFKKFIGMVQEFLNSDNTQKLVQNYISDYLATDFFNSDIDTIEQIRLFIHTSLLHIWLKSNPYDYQLIAVKYDGDKPLAYAAFLINANSKIDIELLKHLQLALNIAFNNITQILEWTAKEYKSEAVKTYSQLTEIKSSGADSALIYTSDKMRLIDYEITRFARTDESVLLLGETGVGKDLIASEIHKRSKRKDKPFVVVSLNSLSEQIIDSELFGSVKGSYTGSIETKKGKFEEANGGTIYLPEISEIPLNIQIKLLEFLQYKSVSKVGGNRLKVDVRIIFASNNNLENLLADGKLRTDFYHRIYVLRILVPPLRNRKEDIVTLANYFVLKHSTRIVGEEYKFANNVDGVLSNQEWKGNVRQLEHFIIRAIVKSDGSEIKKSTIDELLLEQIVPNGEINSNQIIDFKSTEKEFKRQYFISLLKQTNGCVSETARVAGLTRQAVYKILNELDIEYQ